VPLPTHLAKPGLFKCKAAQWCRASVEIPGRHGPVLTKIRDATIRDCRVFDRWLDGLAGFISWRTASSELSRTEWTGLEIAREGPDG
jgi:hypothetical protein